MKVLHRPFVKRQTLNPKIPNARSTLLCKTLIPCNSARTARAARSRLYVGCRAARFTVLVRAS